jgi:hypothetical protein
MGKVVAHENWSHPKSDQLPGTYPPPVRGPAARSPRGGRRVAAPGRMLRPRPGPATPGIARGPGKLPGRRRSPSRVENCGTRSTRVPSSPLRRPPWPLKAMEHLAQVIHQHGPPPPFAGHHQVADHPLQAEIAAEGIRSFVNCDSISSPQPGFPVRPPEPLMQAIRDGLALKRPALPTHESQEADTGKP